MANSSNGEKKYLYKKKKDEGWIKRKKIDRIDSIKKKTISINGKVLAKMKKNLNKKKNAEERRRRRRKKTVGRRRKYPRGSILFKKK